jgi:hypothetical protein
MCGRGPRSTLRILRHGLEVWSWQLVSFVWVYINFVSLRFCSVGIWDGRLWTARKPKCCVDCKAKCRWSVSFVYMLIGYLLAHTLGLSEVKTDYELFEFDDLVVCKQFS